MGSKRVVGLLVVLALLAPAAATSASAVTPEDARPVAEQFVRAFITEDAPTVCSLLSARLAARFASVEACVQTLFPPARAAANEFYDREALSRLELGFEAARLAALDSPTGRFPTPAKKLSLAVRSLLPLTRVVVGAGATVVRDTDTRTLGIDRTRSTATRVVFYAESDSGVIFRLAGTLRGTSKVAAVAQGVPAEVEGPGVEPLPPFALASRALPDGPEAALVVVTLSVEGQTAIELPVRLVVEAGGWKVDGMYVDLLTQLVAIGTEFG